MKEHAFTWHVFLSSFKFTCGTYCGFSCLSAFTPNGFGMSSFVVGLGHQIVK
jgi:hypothetical protein